MNEDQIEIMLKEADESDAKKLLVFIQKVSKQSSYAIFPSLEKEITIEQEKEFIRKFLSSRNDLLLIAHSEKDIIGIVTIRSYDNEEMMHVAELGIVVDEEHSGFGLGSVLISEAIHWSSEISDLVRLEVEVQVTNNKALHLYEKTGFKEEGYMKKRVKVNSEFVDTIMMAKIVK